MHERSPTRWAADITLILNQVLAEKRFPVPVIDVAQEVSRSIYPSDAITLVKARRIDGFEGMLAPAPQARGKAGWGIFYNDGIQIPGRINFTLAHEFGHYLVHRLQYPEGRRCTQRDMTSWNSEYAKVEAEANLFAANLLMPLDDFRVQLPANVSPSFDDLGVCASRYDVSLTAAILRWLEYTSKRSLLVASTDGFVLWAKPSRPALRSGLYIKTRGVPPVPLPEQSLACSRAILADQTACLKHAPGVWFPKEGCEEFVLLADRFDFTLSLLHFDDDQKRYVGEEADDDDVLLPADFGMKWR